MWYKIKFLTDILSPTISLCSSLAYFLSYSFHQCIFSVFGVCVYLQSASTMMMHNKRPDPVAKVETNLFLFSIEPNALSNQFTTFEAPHIEWHLKPTTNTEQSNTRTSKEQIQRNAAWSIFSILDTSAIHLHSCQIFQSQYQKCFNCLAQPATWNPSSLVVPKTMRPSILLFARQHKLSQIFGIPEWKSSYSDWMLYSSSSYSCEVPLPMLWASNLIGLTELYRGKQ